MKRFKSGKINKIFLTTYVMLSTACIYASTTSDLPIITTFDKLKKAMTGEFAQDAVAIAIVACAICSMYGNFAEGTKRMIAIVFWGAIAVMALQMMSSLFGVSGALI